MQKEENLTFEERITDIRTKWASSDKRRDSKLCVPEGLKCLYDISYGQHGEANLLDIYMSAETCEKQAAIVNIHGGAWVYGSKEVYKFYCMSLAKRGFVVVNINYRLAPENLFPSALEDINQALTFIEQQGEEYFIDREKLILVGDSAGGQLVSHYSAIFTNPDYAKKYSFTLPNIKIRAVGLNCGLYDTKNAVINDYDGMYKVCFEKDSDFTDRDFLSKIDVISNITQDFPPSFVMSSHEDFLLYEAQPMYDLLKSKGVESILKIYGSKGNRKIGHVFHVNMNLPEAKICNDEECEFFRRFV